VTGADLGPFAGLVGTAGCAISAGAALFATWSGGADWAPQDADMLKGPGRIAGLASTALIVVLWAGTRPPGSYPYLPALALVLVLLTFATFVAYQLMTLKLTFTDCSDPKNPRKRTGGFRMLESARKTMAEKQETPQMFLAGAAYNPEEAWTPGSIAQARVALLLAFLILVVSGTVALATVALVAEKALV
jgi:hypothetical protein